MTKKVLITGGAGFIGFHLASRLLKDGFTVDLVDNFSRGVRDPELQSLLSNFSSASFACVDCLDQSETRKIADDYSYIFNMAAIIGVQHVIKQPYRVLLDNLKLLDNLIQVAQIQKNLERFFFPSSSEVTAGTLEHFHLPIPTPEHVPLAVADLKRPRTSYMLSKIAGEYLCHYSDIPYTIFRPHNIYGPRMGLAHVIPGQLKKAFDAKDDDYVSVASVDQTRCFCYIDDAVEQLIRMMNRSASAGETLNLGAESPEATILEVAKICHVTVGKKVLIKEEPPPLGSPRRRGPDMSKTVAITGYISQIGLVDGINRTYEWYRDNIFTAKVVSAK
jgi:UDP-glucose 4-epimerase